MKFLIAAFTVISVATAGVPVGRAQVNDTMLADETDGTNWPAIGRTFSEDHYSPLTQITDQNISRLGLAAFTDLPTVVSAVTAPVEVDGVLYFAIGLSVVHAVDVKSGKLLWRYDPDVPAVAGDKLKPAWGSRGVAFWDGKVYVGTQDGRLIAVDAKTGNPVWSIITTEPGDGRYITGAPRVFNGKVVIGHAGGDFTPTRGYVTAYDAATGKQLWRFYTVPGNPKDGFEDEAQAMAAKTWSGEWWKFGGGGTVWNAMAYDPQFNRLYIGTGNGEPWSDKIRGPGKDNLFLCSIVALDADTGKYVWHYQVNPGDTWDFDATMDIELATLTLDGKPRPVLMQAPKDGFFYIIDRETGKLLSAEKIGKVNWAERIDLETGRPVENPAARFAQEPFLMYPGAAGAHNIQVMAYNPIAGLVFIPAREQGWVYSDVGVDHKNWKPEGQMVINSGLSEAPTKLVAPPGKSMLLAWDPVRGRPAWSIPTPGATGGGVATTAGNLVFQGQADGKFLAYAADTGKLVWSFDARNGILAQPISYMIEGKQYITVIAGFGGINAAASGGVFGWDFSTQKRRLLTFALDGTADLPPATPYRLEVVDDPAFRIDPTLADAGAGIYAKHCLTCHGPGVIAGGAAPDLRASQVALSKDAFIDVVHDGSLVSAGMPRFGDFSPEDMQGLMHYIRSAERNNAPAVVAQPPR